MRKSWLMENNFIWHSDPSRLKKFIYHYEIFKMTKNLKGSVVECGVFKGNSLIRFLTYNSLFKNKNKNFFAFDTFAKFPNSNFHSDKKFIDKWSSIAGQSIKKNELNKILNRKKFKNVKLVEGNIFKTLKKVSTKYIKKISFLHLDLDTYDPTYYALNILYKKVEKGGVILIDDYGTVEGATVATNKFIKENNLKINRIELDFKPIYLVKN
tara:strand:+ start:28 stop:660 length:633 start_codon:yes stop_codon:yes gene_type:complete